jgi:hypothetical protein
MSLLKMAKLSCCWKWTYRPIGLARLLLASAAALAYGAPAWAQTSYTALAVDAVTLQAGQGVDHNLLQLPGAVGRGQLRREPSHFTGVSLSRDGGQLGERWATLASSPLASWREGYEFVLLQHRGLQRNAEIGAAYVLRTPTLHAGPVGVNGASGLGLSYALGTPTYEDGPADEPGRRYRLQLLALFELEWTWRDVNNLALITRVHHRSGAYGLIAPPRVGSNFLAVGLRWGL